ncbi:MAG: hypothetical protein ABI599_13885 [Flavobacteriales bacterium]
MYKAFFLLALALIGSMAASATTLFPSPASYAATAFVGGDPRIQLCGKLTGEIAKTDLQSAMEVKLAGCVSSARITTLTLCIKDCKSKQETLTSTSGVLTPAMKKMIANLPAGTPFSVRVAVMDASGKKWEVPDAAFVWKG